MRTTLTMIAADMNNEALRRGTSRRELPRGLAMELVQVGGTKTLVLSRPVTPPGAQEIEICRAAFGVPADAQRNDGEVTVTLRWPT